MQLLLLLTLLSFLHLASAANSYPFWTVPPIDVPTREPTIEEGEVAERSLKWIGTKDDTLLNVVTLIPTKQKSASQALQFLNWASWCTHPTWDSTRTYTLPHMRDYLHHYARMWALTRAMRFSDLSPQNATLEHHWISHFHAAPARFFYPIVPLFVQWRDLLKGKNPRVEELSSFIRKLRKDYIYVTVFTSGCGLEKDGLQRPNIIRLGAGGMGHIALPHIVKADLPEWVPRSDSVRREVMFRGKAKYGSGDLDANVNARNLLKKAIGSNAQSLAKAGVHIHARTKPIPFKDYKKEIDNHGWIMAPRGFARATFRFYETLASGAIPVYIFDDMPFLPYLCVVNWTDISFLIHETKINRFMSRLPDLVESEETAKMWDRIREMRDEYFTLDAVFRHLRDLFYDPQASALRVCNPLHRPGPSPCGFTTKIRTRMRGAVPCVGDPGAMPDSEWLEAANHPVPRFKKEADEEEDGAANLKTNTSFTSEFQKENNPGEKRKSGTTGKRYSHVVRKKVYRVTRVVRRK